MAEVRPVQVSLTSHHGRRANDGVLGDSSSRPENLQWDDWLVFGATVGTMLLVGIYFACIKKQKTTTDLLLGGKNMSIVPTTISLLSTFVPVFVVLGTMGDIYSKGTLIAEIIIAFAVFTPLSGFIFLPTFIRLEIRSAYEYLELRYNSKVIRWMTTLVFMFQVTMVMGVMIYLPALIFNVIFKFPISLTMVILGLAAGAVSSLGGLKAVVWTDVIQTLLMTAILLAIIIQGCVDLGGWREPIQIAKSHERIQFLKFVVDPFTNESSLNLFFGLGVHWLASLSCHQVRVQRLISMATVKRASAVLLLAVPGVVVIMTLSVIAGIVIFSNYAGCDPVTLGFVHNDDQVTSYFVMEHLSPVKGMRGLFIAFIIAGTLSSSSAAVSGLATSTWEDFLKKLKFFNKMSETGKARSTKVLGFVFSVILIGMGFVASNMGGVLSAGLTINGALLGPLLGTFLPAILIPFNNQAGAISGLIGGLVASVAIATGGYIFKSPTGFSSFSIDQCDQATLDRVGNDTLALIMGNVDGTDTCEIVEWPRKIFSLSYMLYPIVGSGVAVIIGIFVSLLTGPTKMTKELEPYIHPWIVKLVYKINRINEERKSSFVMAHKDFQFRWETNKAYVNKGRNDYTSFYDYDQDQERERVQDPVSTQSTITLNSILD